MNYPCRTHWFKRALPWALYDWANSAFALTLMAAFVPVFKQGFLERRRRAGVAPSGWRGQFDRGRRRGDPGARLGGIADRAGRRKGPRVFRRDRRGDDREPVVGRQRPMGVALTLYALACVGLRSERLLRLAAGERGEEDKFDVVSALGYSLATSARAPVRLQYLDVLEPERFGLPDKSAAVRGRSSRWRSGGRCFRCRCFGACRKPHRRVRKRACAPRSRGFRQLRETFRDIRQLRAVWLFLIAYWLYIDGVDTVVGWRWPTAASWIADGSLMLALLITQLVGFPAALVFGKLASASARSAPS